MHIKKKILEAKFPQEVRNGITQLFMVKNSKRQAEINVVREQIQNQPSNFYGQVDEQCHLQNVLQNQQIYQ